MISVFDPRARYLTGLGAGPSARALVGRRRYNRMFIGAYDPRRRYLSGLRGYRGLGDDTGIDVTYSAPLPTQLGPDPIYSYAGSETPIPFLPTITGTTTYTPSAPPINFVPAGSPPAAPTAAQISMAATGAKPLVPSIVGPTVAPAALSPSWFAQNNPTLGISNSTLMLGFGFLLVVMVAGSGGKRR